MLNDYHINYILYSHRMRYIIILCYMRMRVQNYIIVRTRTPVETFRPEHYDFLFFVDVVVVVDLRAHIYFCTCLFFPLSLVICSMYDVKIRMTWNRKRTDYKCPKILAYIILYYYDDFYTLILLCLQLLLFYVFLQTSFCYCFSCIW